MVGDKPRKPHKSRITYLTEKDRLCKRSLCYLGDNETINLQEAAKQREFLEGQANLGVVLRLHRLGNVYITGDEKQAPYNVMEAAQGAITAIKQFYQSDSEKEARQARKAVNHAADCYLALAATIVQEEREYDEIAGGKEITPLEDAGRYASFAAAIFNALGKLIEGHLKNLEINPPSDRQL